MHTDIYFFDFSKWISIIFFKINLISKLEKLAGMLKGHLS